MGYYLGVDIGTTYTAAAVWRDGRCDVANLGNRAPTIPSVVFLRDDGTVLVGEAAVRRGSTDPGGVAREFKRRVGDPTPVIVGGTPYSADALMARLLRAVVDLVATTEGAPPDGIAVTHPANWGPYKLDLLRQATRIADLDDVVTVSEPEAAAIHYASQSRVEPGAVIAVYDLGGGTFDAAVLRKTGPAWEVLGSPEGIERLGGVDFDAAVHHHVASSIGGALDALSPDDPAALAAAARLRQECVDAKEALSADSDVSIPVLLPSLQTEVRLTRSEYEQMVRPALADTITSLTRALRSAKVEPADVTTVLLVGGSSRTPLVAELVSSALGRPVAVDAHPKYGVALGAAITAAMSGGKASAAESTSVEVPPTEIAPPPVQATTALATSVDPAPLAPAAAGASASDPSAGVSTLGPAAAGAPAAPSAIDTQVHALAAPSAADPASRRTVRVPASGAPSTPDRPADPPSRRSRSAASGSDGGRDTRSIRVPYSGEQIPAVQTGGRGPTGEVPSVPGGGRPGPERGKRVVLALAAVAAVLALGVGALALFGGGDDDEDSGGNAEVSTGSGDQVSGASDVPASAEAPAGDGGSGATASFGPFVVLHSADFEGDQLRVDYEVFGLAPSFDGLHVHFFPDTTDRNNAGENGNPPERYYATDESGSALTDLTREDFVGASQVCAAVADHDHGVIDQGGDPTGNCVVLP